MGNQNNPGIASQPDKQTSFNPETMQRSQLNTAQKVWQKSQKNIADLDLLIKSEPKWHVIIRPFLRKITSRQQYQLYLRAILQAILQSFPSESNFKSNNDMESRDKNQTTSISQMIPQNQEQFQKSNQNRMNQQEEQFQQAKKRKQMSELFNFFKLKLQQSYFVISYEKSGVRESMGQTDFQQSLKLLWQEEQNRINNKKESQSQVKTSYLQGNFSFQRLIPSLMLSQLYQYSSINQNYMNEMFIQLNIKAYNSLEEFTKLLIEDFITVDDDSNLSKFIVTREVFDQSLTYLETCAKILSQKQQFNIFQQIKYLKQNPTSHYIQMCQIFLHYKNVIGAQVIIRNLIQKGYKLSEQEIKFYFYVLAYAVFLYNANFSSEKLYQLQIKEFIQENQGTFLSFENGFQRFSIQQIFHYFLLQRPYNEIEVIKNCFETAFNLREPSVGNFIFLRELKFYVFGQKSQFRIVIEALRNHLKSIGEEKKKDIQGLFLRKLSDESCKDILDFERYVIDLVKTYKFSSQGFKFVKTLFKVSSILTKFQIYTKVFEVSQFLFHNKNMVSLNQLKQTVLGNKSNQKSIQQLQFLALVIIKKVITKYFVLGQSKQEVVFIIEDKFDEQCFQYSTKQIQSLFILTEYLHKNVFETFVPLQQLHQLLFQHMLYFGKYDHVETMLRQQNLDRYFIQVEVVKLLIVDHIRETLITSQKSISSISQEIKKQLKIVENIVKNESFLFENQAQMIDNLTTHNNFSSQDIEQIQSIKALFRLLIKLDFYSISLNQQQKQNIGISLLYFLIEHYQHQIEVFDYDTIYRLIVLAEAKNHQLVKEILSVHDQHTLITNQYLKFKIDLAHLAFQKGKIKFGQNVLKQVLQYEPPWISSEIIKIIRAMPNSTGINQYFLNLAFEYCVKGQDLMYLLKVWKQKVHQKQKKTGQKITEIFESSKKFMVVDDSYIKDQKQYRNLIGQMSFNDEILKSLNYDLFFTLLGTQTQRAFYLIYSKNLDIVKIEIILKQGMKMGIFNILNTSKMFFKLLFIIFEGQRLKKQQVNQKSTKVSYIKFKNISVDEVINKLEERRIFSDGQKNSPSQREISFIMLKKMYKALKSLLTLPTQFIRNYIQNGSLTNQESDDAQLLYMFAFDENYREKLLIALKDEPMGRSDIKIYKDLCQINGMNILDLTIFNLTNYFNTIQHHLSEEALEDEKIQNMLQKIVTWTENDSGLIHSILSKFIQKIFSSQMLFSIFKYIRERQNPLIREIITLQHMQIIQSLKQIQIHTQFHGLVTEQFFERPISFNPKHNLSEKHIKILKKQLKLRNVFLISKILYFCYGMSTDIEKQVLKLFVKQNENEQEIQIYNQIKRKIHESES